MTQVYSVPGRESDPHSLPDVEVFEVTMEDIERDIERNGKSSIWRDDIAESLYGPGWYYWYCLPGCLPDGDPIGPFGSEAEAIEDAQSEAWQFENDDETEGDE